MLEQHVTNLMLTKGITREEAEVFVKKVLKERNTPPKLRVLAYDRPGYEVDKEITFNDYMKASKDNITAPNGRVYWDPEVKPSMMRKYTKSLLDKRAYHKKRMFAFAQEGKDEHAAIEKGAESKTKIATNTITAGAKNSAYSAFFDKAGFNAITAVARLMIKTSYSIIEQNLGGNFYWESLDELKNWIILQVRHSPTEEVINNLVVKYNLHQPSKQELMDRFQFFMNLYEVGPAYLHREEFYNYEKHVNSSLANEYIQSETVKYLLNISPIKKSKDAIVNLSSVQNMVDRLPQHLVTYMYYLNNIRLLFWKNEATFKPILMNIVNGFHGSNEVRSPSDIFNLDKDYPPIISTKYAEQMKGKDIDKVVKEEPELAQVLANYANHIHNIFLNLDDVISVFCKPPVAGTRTSIKERMWRNTTLGSDTDSVLYTLKEWMVWFTGDEFTATIEGYTCTAIMSYYVAKIAAHSMLIFSEHLGAKGNDRFYLEMKGEYDFKSMVFYPIKKHYTGVMDKQEGRVLPKLKLDIKGIGLRNSSVPKTVAGILQQFVLDTQEKQSVSYFIKKVTDTEKHMAHELRTGDMHYLKSISVNDIDSYDNPDGSAYFYLQFWNEVFGDKYGFIHPPVKPPSAFLLPMSTERLEIIRKIDPKIHKKLVDFKNKYPNRKELISIVINPLLSKTPEEIIVLMNLRKHIYTNMKPLYLSLESYGMPLMHNDKKQLLLCDYYSELDLKLLESEEDGEEES